MTPYAALCHLKAKFLGVVYENRDRQFRKKVDPNWTQIYDSPNESHSFLSYLITF